MSRGWANLTMIGHNCGPALEEGAAWRRHCWTRAREDLLPHLPVEVVRLRLARAKALGLDYKTYAGLRAQTGRDLVGFLFSANALGLRRSGDHVPAPRLAKVAALAAPRLGLASRPFPPERLCAACPPLTGAAPAPQPFAPWAIQRAALRAALGALPGAGVVLVGEAPWEAEWCAAGRLAGYIPAARFFAAAS